MRMAAVKSGRGVAQQTPQGGSSPGDRDLAGLKVHLIGTGWLGAEILPAEGVTGSALLLHPFLSSVDPVLSTWSCRVVIR